MKFEKDNVSDIHIAYIGGGSQGWAWSFMTDLALEKQLSGDVRLCDVDYSAAQINERVGNLLSRRDDVTGKWTYEATTTLQEALSGADFVVISILPGTFEEMRSDVHAPEKYGIYQSVGDTTGPGGLLRALRTIPMYVEIAEAIKAFSPQAWVINYTNPMALCVRTLYEVFPEIKAFGCCHEVFGTQELLACMLREMAGIEHIERHEIKINVLGINHFTWIDKASYDSTDLMPLYKTFVDRHHEEGYEKLKGPWRNSYFFSAERVKFDLFRRYGLIAASGDRHLAEFMPPWFYLKNPSMAESWKFHLTPVKWRIERKKEREEKGRRLAEGHEQVELKHSGEEGVSQIKALLGLGDLVTNVNLPNRGQLKGLPEDAVVETNALFAYNNLAPVLAGNLPTDVNSLVARHVFNQEAILEASLSRDTRLALNAFLNDPLVCIRTDDARDLFNQMLNNTKQFLPGWSI